jgi:oxygen-dependent protoporphyrinogen oxidase
VHGLYFQELSANSAVLPAAVARFAGVRAAPVGIRGGLGRLTAALARELDVEYGVRVEQIERDTARGGAVVRTSRGRQDAAVVVVATPADPARRMLGDPTPYEDAVLRVPYSPGLLVGVALDARLDDDELDGAYGVLFGPDEESALAAMAVGSRSHCGSNDGAEVLTLMLRPSVARNVTADDEAVAIALDALAPWLPGAKRRMSRSAVIRWRQAMPHLPLGHAHAVRQYRSHLPGGSPVVLAGDYLGFPWSDSAAANGLWAADRALDTLDPQG